MVLGPYPDATPYVHELVGHMLLSVKTNDDRTVLAIDIHGAGTFYFGLLQGADYSATFTTLSGIEHLTGHYVIAVEPDLTIPWFNPYNEPGRRYGFRLAGDSGQFAYIGYTTTDREDRSALIVFLGISPPDDSVLHEPYVHK